MGPEHLTRLTQNSEIYSSLLLGLKLCLMPH